MVQRNDGSSAPIAIDSGLEVSRAPWPRADDPKQVYVDRHNGMPTESTPMTKPEDDHPPYGQNTDNSSPRRNKVLFGLGITAWSVLLVALTAVIIGAAVGGGIGGALASCNSDKSDLNSQLASCTGGGESVGGACLPSVSIALATATITVSGPSGTTVVEAVDLNNYTAAAPATVQNVFVDCPALDGQSYTTVRGENFDIHCNGDSHSGGAALEGSGLTIKVLTGFTAYSLNDCMEGCSAFNWFTARNNLLTSETQCRSITFNHAMSSSLQNNGNVNCWIKNGTVATSSLVSDEDSISCMMSS